jgi:hypothetical protein
MTKPPLPKLVKKADKLFSLYIRKRDCTTYIETEEGISIPAGKCITCPKIIAFNQGDCGHFIKRGCKLTRFDERNANLQCMRCNRFNEGEQYKHGLAIDEKYGPGTTDELLALEKRYYRESCKLSREQIELIIERYK